MMCKATIDSLPNELLENIFEAGARDPISLEENYPRLPLFSKQALVPLYAAALSQVCIRWKDITSRMPILWSFIHLTRSLESHRRLRSDLGKSLDWVLVYLERSRTLPIHIIIDTTRIPVAPTVDLLAPYSKRWSTLTILVSHVGTLPPILPLFVHTDIPNLSHFSITSDIYREGIVCFDPFVPFFVHSTPKLATIRLTGVYITWNAPPLANLQNLELHFTTRWPSFDDLGKMFAASPQLRRLAVRDDLNLLLLHVDQPAGRPNIEIPSLTHLDVELYRHRDEYVDVVAFMGLFTLSSLESLALRGLRLDEWLDVTENYDLPRNIFDIPIPSRGHDKYLFRRRHNYPFLSHVVATSHDSGARKPARLPPIDIYNFHHTHFGL